MRDQIIGVDSLLELYTTVFGWHQYNQIWQILTETGIVFIPFFGILLKHFLGPSTSVLPVSASLTSLKRVEIDIIMMMTVIVLAGQPLITLKTSQLKLVKLCQSQGDHFSNDETTFAEDNSLLRATSFTRLDDNARVPLWWYAVMAISSGTTYSLKHSLPCVDDIRALRARVDSTVIQDKGLFNELSQFLRDCYYPAYTFIKLSFLERSGYPKWSREYETMLQNVKRLPDPEGNIDKMQLFAPHLFLKVPYLYHELKASTPIPSMKILVSEDPNSGQHQFARPLCIDWWGHKDSKHFENSLYVRLKKEADTHAKELLTHFSKNPKTSIPSRIAQDFAKEGEDLKEIVYIMVMIRIIKANFYNKKESIYITQNDVMKGGDGGTGTIAKWWNKGGSMFGFIYKGMQEIPMVYLAQEAAYVIQALILMCLYLMLPIGLVLSGYSFQYLWVAAVGIFTFKFIGYLLHLAWWIDRNLYAAIKAPIELNLKTGLWTPIWEYVSSKPEDFKINIITLGMYFTLPMIAIGVFGWAGFQVIAGAAAIYERFGGGGGIGASAGQRGGQAIQRLGKNIAIEIGRALRAKK